MRRNTLFKDSVPPNVSIHEKPRIPKNNNRHKKQSVNLANYQFFIVW